jgi:hypothetical protein
MRRFVLCALFLALQVLAVACTYEDHVRLNEFLSQRDETLEDTGYLLDALPENLGYLVTDPLKEPGALTVFDADTSEVFRTVELVPTHVGFPYWVDVGPAGRVWVGYLEELVGIFEAPGRSGVMVFTPEGDLVRDLETNCGPPDSGVAFANGYAFIGCAASGFTGMVVVVDLNSLDMVKAFDNIHPPGQDPAETHYYMDAVAEAADMVLVTGFGGTPEGYSRLTHYAGHYTRVGVIDPATLEFRGFLTDLEPGLKVESVIEVDGKAWLLNSLSHLEERPERTDVYVMDVQALEVVDRFNLDHPFPQWGEWGDDGAIYIFHEAPSHVTWEAGHPSGVTRLDPDTGEETFTEVPNPPRVTGMRLNGNRACMPSRFKAGRGDGVWCLNAEGELELKSSQDIVKDVAFARASTRD